MVGIINRIFTILSSIKTYSCHVFLLLFVQVNIQSQQLTATQLSTSFSSAKTDLERAIIYDKICEQHFTNNTDKAYQMCQTAIQYAKSANHDSLTIINLNRIAINLHFTISSDSSTTYLQESLNIAKLSGNKALLQPAYYSYASFYLRNIDIESTVKMMLDGKAIADELNDHFYKVKFLEALGSTYFDAGNYIESLKNHKEALGIARANLDTKLIATIQGYIAMSLRELGEYDEARRYFEKALNYYKSINNELSISRIYYGMAKLEFKKENYSNSIKILFT